MSTVQPATELRLPTRSGARAQPSSECPVGAPTGPARQGQLIGLDEAPSPADAREWSRCSPDVSRLEHCGPVGAGSTNEACDQPAADGLLQASGEAFRADPRSRYRPGAPHHPVTDISAATNAIKARAAMIAR